MSGVLVYAAPSAQRLAEKLLPGRVVVELEVERAILAGRKRRYGPAGGRRRDHCSGMSGFCLINRKIGALLVKEPSRVSGRKSWRVIHLLEPPLPKEVRGG